MKHNYIIENDVKIQKLNAKERGVQEMLGKIKSECNEFLRYEPSLSWGQ